MSAGFDRWTYSSDWAHGHGENKVPLYIRTSAELRGFVEEFVVIYPNEVPLICNLAPIVINEVKVHGWNSCPTWANCAYVSLNNIWFDSKSSCDFCITYLCIYIGSGRWGTVFLPMDSCCRTTRICSGEILFSVSSLEDNYIANLKTYTSPLFRIKVQNTCRSSTIVSDAGIAFPLMWIWWTAPNVIRRWESFSEWTN